MRSTRRRRADFRPLRRRPAYVLLETVVATGLLIVGLAVIGSQVQSAETSIRKMDRRLRAMALAEQHLAELDLGLVELESADDTEEGDFGPRYPDYGWLLTTDDTAIDDMFLLRLDVLFLSREDDYREDDFEFDDAETLYTVYAMRTTPRPIDFAADFGLNDEELDDLAGQLGELGIEGLDPLAFDPALLGKIDFEELITALPAILGAFRMDVSQIVGTLPPSLLRQLEDSGVLGEEGVSGLLGGAAPGGGS